MKTRVDLAEYFKKQKLNTGVEVGVLGGSYSIILCQANPELKLYSIDSWGLGEKHKKVYHERKYQEAQTRLAGYNTELVRARSLDAAQNFPNNKLGFVYLDASHNFEGVMNDLMAWTPKVKKGGIMSGDDYNTSRDVKLAVDAYSSAHRYKLNLTTYIDRRGTINWWFVKRWNS